jgi:hypothetical protein
MKRSRLVAVAAVTLALTGSSSQAGLYYPPTSDTLPLVSHDGSAVLFYRSGSVGAEEPVQAGLHVMRPDGTHERQLAGLPANPSFGLSRTWRWIAFSSYDNGPAIVVMRPDGSESRVVLRADVGDFITGITWAPDEQRLAFVRRDGVWTVRIDGTGLEHVAAGTTPAWSPDGTQLAFQVGDRVALAAPDGSNLRRVDDSAPSPVPVWSPDGSKLAYVRSSTQISVVTADGSRVTRYPAHAGPSGLAWASDSERFAYAALGTFEKRKRAFVGRGIWEITLAKRTLAAQQQLLGARGPGRQTLQPAFGGGLSWAPDRRWLFASSGGICRDRGGIHRIDIAHRTATRLTNDCHVRGTRGADDLSGTSVYDILLGYAGDDHLTTVDGNYQATTRTAVPATTSWTAVGGRTRSTAVPGTTSSTAAPHATRSSAVPAATSSSAMEAATTPTHATASATSSTAVGTTPRPAPTPPGSTSTTWCATVSESSAASARRILAAGSAGRRTSRSCRR